MLKTFLDSYKKSLTKSYAKLIQTMSVHPNLIIHHPIIAQSAIHPILMKIKSCPSSPPIIKNVSVMMTSTSHSFSSINLIGATANEKNIVQRFFDEGSKDHSIIQREHNRGLFRILIQIFANEQQLTNSEMPLHYLANLIVNQAYIDQNNLKDSVLHQLGLDIDFTKQKYAKYIKTQGLSYQIKSFDTTIKQLYKLLSSKLVKTVSQQQFINIFKLVRAQLRQIHQPTAITMNNTSQQQNETKIQVFSPILSAIKSSHNPNCILVGKYFTHARQSFYSLQTRREIKPGQQLTIPVRSKGMYDVDKLMRLGYQSVLSDLDNPLNEIIVPINFVNPAIKQVSEIMTTGDIDQKKSLLELYNLQMSPYVTIIKNGNLAFKDLKMMRILFGVQQHEKIVSSKMLEGVDTKINGFIVKFVDLLLLQSQQKLKVPDLAIQKDIKQGVVQAIRHIQQGDVQLLKQFLKIHKQK